MWACFDGIGGRQVVVLAGVDDDAGEGVDHPGEVLVDERALHVDVAEEDAVHAQSFSIMSSRSRAPMAAISGMHRPEQ